MAGEPTLVVLAAALADGEPYLRELAGVELAVVAQGLPEFAAAVADAQVVICAGITRSETAGATRLTLIHTPGTGVDRFELAALPPGCMLCNTFGHENALAEWIVMGALALARDLLGADRSLRTGDWSARLGSTPMRELRGQTLGLVGFGRIGRRTAELGRGLGMRTIGVTRAPDPRRSGELDWLGGLDQLRRLLAESDFAAVSLPLSEETRDLVGAAELAALGPSGFLLNVGRGAVVNEQALYSALQAGTIAGAAIDVWYRYPPSLGETTLPASLPFWELGNVIMTPHLAGLSQDSTETRWRFVQSQLERLADGRTLENVVAVGGSARAAAAPGGLGPS